MQGEIDVIHMPEQYTQVNIIRGLGLSYTTAPWNLSGRAVVGDMVYTVYCIKMA